MIGIGYIVQIETSYITSRGAFLNRNTKLTQLYNYATIFINSTEAFVAGREWGKSTNKERIIKRIKLKLL